MFESNSVIKDKFFQKSKVEGQMSMDLKKRNHKPKNEKGKASFDVSFYRAYALYGGLVFQLVATIVLLLLGGKYLDQKLDTHPIFLVIGVLLGTTLGFYNFFRMLQFYQKKQNKTDE